MKKDRVISFGICIGVGSLLFAFCAYSQGLFESQDFKTTIGILSDCFLIPGVLLAGCGGLSWVASQGAFTTLRYAFASLLAGFRHPTKQFPSFYEYKQERDALRKPWLKSCLFTGVGFLAAAVICVVIYLV